MRAAGPVVVVDAGNLFWRSAGLSADDRPQQVEKARVQAAAYALVGIDAMLPGAGDLALGLPLVRELAEANHLPYVAANLECDGGHPFPAARVVEAGGLHIAIVGIVGNSTNAEGCHVTEPVAAARAALADNPADVVVVLSGEKLQEDDALAAALPTVSLVVNGQEREQLEQPRALPNGGLLLAAGSRGKQLGALAFTLTPGATAWRDAQVLGRLADQRDKYAARLAELELRREKAKDDAERARFDKQVTFFEKEVAGADAKLAAAAAATGPAHVAKNRLVDMGTDLADHPATAALVAAAKTAVEAIVPVDTVSALATGPFAGNGACTGCHPAQAAQWASTAHARAWTTLKGANRERDRECYSCHVTGALHPDGPHDPGAVGGLEAVGCEACHGPGRAHVGNPPTVEMIAHPDTAVCAGCHDGERDGGRFDLATYLPQVVH
jgi:2',3'-cyclic-nucleotide 2'-phosphodiesterase (5'-nucleotidase family)